VHRPPPLCVPACVCVCVPVSSDRASAGESTRTSAMKIQKFPRKKTLTVTMAHVEFTEPQALHAAAWPRWSPDGTRLAWTAAKGRVVVWAADLGTKLCDRKPLPEEVQARHLSHTPRGLNARRWGLTVYGVASLGSMWSGRRTDSCCCVGTTRATP
jgi:hypothetical protein